MGRSRGGPSTTIHARCGSESDALDRRITAGQAGDAPVGDAMIDASNPCDGMAQAARDRAYDRHAIRATRDATGITPVMPPQANRLESMVDDTEQDKQRNKVARLCNKLKQFRRVATRYAKRTALFLSFVILALIVVMLR
jgi:transposase